MILVYICGSDRRCKSDGNFSFVPKIVAPGKMKSTLSAKVMDGHTELEVSKENCTAGGVSVSPCALWSEEREGEANLLKSDAEEYSSDRQNDSSLLGNFSAFKELERGGDFRASNVGKSVHSASKRLPLTSVICF